MAYLVFGPLNVCTYINIAQPYAHYIGTALGLQ